MKELHVMNKDGDLLRAYALGDGAEIIVGREESCDVQILARSVSREHCIIESAEGKAVLRDLKSSGGTFVDGKEIDEVELTHGMEFIIGPAVIRFYDEQD